MTIHLNIIEFINLLCAPPRACSTPLWRLQVAVLAGDYLLARASVLLAKLDNVDVVQIMASALDALVQGEIAQIKSAPNDMLEMSYYLRKATIDGISYLRCMQGVCLSRWRPQILLEIMFLNFASISNNPPNGSRVRFLEVIASTAT